MSSNNGLSTISPWSIFSRIEIQMASKKLNDRQRAMLKRDLMPYIVMPSLKQIGNQYGVNKHTISYYVRQMRSDYAKYRK